MSGHVHKISAQIGPANSGGNNEDDENHEIQIQTLKHRIKQAIARKEWKLGKVLGHDLRVACLQRSSAQIQRMEQERGLS